MKHFFLNNFNNRRVLGAVLAAGLMAAGLAAAPAILAQTTRPTVSVTCDKETLAYTSIIGSPDIATCRANITGGKGPFTYQWQVGGAGVAEGARNTETVRVKATRLGNILVDVLVRDQGLYSVYVRASKNINAVTGTASSTPDLSIENILNIPNPIPQGAQVQFEAVIKNIGGAMTSLPAGGIIVRFANPGNTYVQTCNALTTSLASGQSATVACPDPGTLPSGQYTLTFTVDPDNQVLEVNEGNNWRWQSVNVVAGAAQLPDLSFSSPPSVNPGAPYSNTRPLLNAVVIKDTPIGRDLPVAPVVAFYRDNTELCRTTISLNDINRNNAATATCVPSADLPQGTHQITARVDVTTIIVESNENNNAAGPVSYTVGGAAQLPDLTVENILNIPNPIPQGMRVTFEAVIKNIGGAMTSLPAGGIITRFNTPDNTMRTCDALLTLLGAGQSATVACFDPGTLPNGQYSLTFTVDPDNRLAEANEGNNWRWASVNVVGGAGAPAGLDLTIASVTADPSSNSPRPTFTIAAQKTGNQALSTAPQVAVVKSQLTSSEICRASVDLSDLNANNLALTICSATSDLAGEYQLVAIIDPANVIPESNEGNNRSNTLFYRTGDEERPLPPLPPGQSFTAILSPGWNQISSPAGTIALSDIQGCSISRLYAYNPTSDRGPSDYQRVTQLEPMQGYWAFASVIGSCVATVTGQDATGSSKRLAGGRWNMISSSRSWNAIKNDCELTSRLWHYNPRSNDYTEISSAENLNDFLGYWVKVRNDCTIRE